MTEFLDVPGGRIAYDVRGAGPLVVMAAGMGDLRSTYRHVVPELVAAGYRVALMDLRGHGESSTRWPSHTTSAHGADYVALIRHLGGGPATVVGQSFSPDAAVSAAAELPADITGVVAIAPWAAAKRPGRLMAAVERRVLNSPFLWGVFYTSLHKGPKPADHAAHVATMRARLREPGRTAEFVRVAAPDAKDSAPDRARVRQPVLVLMGEKDPDFPEPRAEAEKFTADLAGPSEIVMVPGAGHYPQAEQPHAVATELLAFLARTAPAPEPEATRDA